MTDLLVMALGFIGRGSTCIFSSLITGWVLCDRDESQLLLLPHTADFDGVPSMSSDQFMRWMHGHGQISKVSLRFEPAMAFLNSFVAVREHVRAAFMIAVVKCDLKVRGLKF